MVRLNKPSAESLDTTFAKAGGASLEGGDTDLSAASLSCIQPPSPVKVLGLLTLVGLTGCQGPDYSRQASFTSRDSEDPIVLLKTHSSSGTATPNPLSPLDPRLDYQSDNPAPRRYPENEQTLFGAAFSAVGDAILRPINKIEQVLDDPYELQEMIFEGAARELRRQALKGHYESMQDDPSYRFDYGTISGDPTLNNPFDRNNTNAATRDDFRYEPWKVRVKDFRLGIGGELLGGAFGVADYNSTSRTSSEFRFGASVDLPSGGWLKDALRGQQNWGDMLQHAGLKLKVQTTNGRHRADIELRDDFIGITFTHAIGGGRP